jgi:prevent-host-death family protein
MQQVNKTNFKVNAFEIMREVQRTKKSVIISERGKPVLEIKPFQEKKKDYFEKLKGSVVDFTDPDKPAFDDDEWDFD